MAALTAVNTGRIVKRQKMTKQAINKQRSDQASSSTTKGKQVRHKVVRHETRNKVRIRNRDNSKIEVKTSKNLRQITNSAKKANSVRISNISPTSKTKRVIIEKLHKTRTKIKKMKKITRTKQNHSTSFLIRTTLVILMTTKWPH